MNKLRNKLPDVPYQRSREEAIEFYWGGCNVEIYRHFGVGLPENILQSLAASLFAYHNEADFEEFIHQFRQLGEWIGP